MSRFQLVSSVDGAMKKPVSPSRDLQTHTEERGRFCCFLFSSFVSFFRDLNIYATSLANNHSRDGREREREGPAGGKSATLVNKTREKKNTIHGAAFGSGERKPSAPSHETPTWR